jgi:hypothetical protein
MRHHPSHQAGCGVVPWRSRPSNAINAYGRAGWLRGSRWAAIQQPTEPGWPVAAQLQSFRTVMYQPTLSAGAAVKCAWPWPV